MKQLKGTTQESRHVLNLALFFFRILTFLNAITNERGKHTGLPFAKKPIHIGGGL